MCAVRYRRSSTRACRTRTLARCVARRAGAPDARHFAASSLVALPPTSLFQQLEWMGPEVVALFDERRFNPFQFKYVKCVTSLEKVRARCRAPCDSLHCLPTDRDDHAHCGYSPGFSEGVLPPVTNCTEHRRWPVQCCGFLNWL
eukprot:scaffold280676_cov27-Tisochrysis_lutea.AAC.4